MKQKAIDSIHADELDMRDELDTRPTPSEELEPVQLDDQPEHLAYTGSKLAENVRDPLIHFLKQNVEVFASDMGGIDRAIITHKLNVSPPSNLSNRKEEDLLKRDKNRSTKKSANSSKPELSGK